MNFFETIEREFNHTKTENGAMTNKSSLSKNLDFFAMAASMRGRQPSDVIQMWESAFAENPDLALKNLYHLRDIRHGNGERDLFRLVIEMFLNRKDATITKDTAKNLLSLIPEYGRWDDLLDLRIRNREIEAIRNRIVWNQIRDDVLNCCSEKPISLLAKWFPLVNSVKDKERVKMAKYYVRKIFRNSYKDARKIIVGLRRYLDVLEAKISRNKWDEVDYEKVPSKANLKYGNSFLRNDRERREKYLKDVDSGVKKMNASVVEPHEIIRKYLENRTRLPSNYINDDLEIMWKNMVDAFPQKNAVCVCDVSGSMFWDFGMSIRPIYVALGLGILFSQKNPSEAFRNKVITFSGTPDLVDVSGDCLAETIRRFTELEWGGSTNIVGCFQKILEAARKNNLSQSEMPETVYIISDMEFDAAITEPDSTIFEVIDEEYRKYGYQRPALVFWNVNSYRHNVPVTKDESGTVLLSGVSKNNFKFVFDPETITPEKMMLDVLMSDRYKEIHL